MFIIINCDPAFVIRGCVKIFGMAVKNEDDCVATGKLDIINILGCNMERLISMFGITYDTSQECRNDFGSNQILYYNDSGETLNCWTK
jgi:hypothetical protein